MALGRPLRAKQHLDPIQEPISDRKIDHTGAFCMNPVSERTSGSLHMQLLSGCPAAAYWLGSYFWDMCTHLIVCLSALGIFLLAKEEVSLVEVLRQAW